jgi:SNF2 family DNA or RNA helicase
MFHHDYFSNYVSDGYAHVLVMLLRLRQCCDHPSLLKHFATDDGGNYLFFFVFFFVFCFFQKLFCLFEEFKACAQCVDAPATMTTSCKHNLCQVCVFVFKNFKFCFFLNITTSISRHALKSALKRKFQFVQFVSGFIYFMFIVIFCLKCCF